MDKILLLDGLRFRENNGVLEASRGSASWEVVATIPVDRYPKLKEEFPVGVGQFILVTPADVGPTTGRFFMLGCPKLPQPRPKKRDDDRTPDVRDVTKEDPDPPGALFKAAYFSAVMTATE